MSEVRNEWDKPAWFHEVMERGHDFGLQADQGMAFFGKVLDREYVRNLKADRYAELAADTSNISWGGGGTNAWNILKDSDGNELLWEDEQPYILQVFTGIDPPDMRVWISYPSGYRVGDLSEILVDSPADIDTPGYWDGIMSPEYEPHRFTEMLIPPGLHVAFMVYNPRSYQTIMPFLVFQIIRYRVQWYDPATDKKTIEQFADFIYNNQKGRPVKFWKPGVRSFQYNSKTNVNVDSVNLEEIAKKLESERSGRSRR